MKAHELARELLERPDHEVGLFITDGVDFEVTTTTVVNVHVDNYMDWPNPVVVIKGFV